MLPEARHAPELARRAMEDPDFYQKSSKTKAEALQKKRAEIEAAMERAETLWLAAQEKLEAESAAV